MESGDLALADAMLAQQESIAEVTPTQLSYLRIRQALRATVAGDLGRAERCVGEAFEAAAIAGEPDAYTFYFSQLASLRYHQGRMDELTTTFAAAVDATPGLPVLRAGLGLIHLEADRLGDVAAVVDELGARWRTVGDELNWLITIALLAELAARIKARELCAELYPVLLPFRDQFVDNATNWFGSVGRFLGLLEHVVGRFDDADRSFAAALRATRRCRRRCSSPAPTSTGACRCSTARTRGTATPPATSGPPLDLGSRYGLAVVERRATAPRSHRVDRRRSRKAVTVEHDATGAARRAGRRLVTATKEDFPHWQAGDEGGPLPRDRRGRLVRGERRRPAAVCGQALQRRADPGAHPVQQRVGRAPRARPGDRRARAGGQVLRRHPGRDRSRRHVDARLLRPPARGLHRLRRGRHPGARRASPAGSPACATTSDCCRRRAPNPYDNPLAPRTAALMRWADDHPESKGPIAALGSLVTPSSYARCAYHGVHTFVLRDADGATTAVRYSWWPVQGVRPADRTTPGLPEDYLHHELRQRLRRGPFEFCLQFLVAETRRRRRRPHHRPRPQPSPAADRRPARRDRARRRRRRMRAAAVRTDPVDRRLRGLRRSDPRRPRSRLPRVGRRPPRHRRTGPPLNRLRHRLAPASATR